MRHLEKMTGHTRLYRRGATYYHRAAVPQDIVETYGKREETFSLRTKDKVEALIRVKVEAVRVDKLDLSRFDAAPLIAFIATKEMNYGNETNG